MDLSDYRYTADLTRASTIPARWYTDPQLLDAERPLVFGRTWQYAGHADAVSTPGSYLACEIAGEPVLVTRDAAGSLRAFSNVCRHRGSLLAEGEGTAKVIRDRKSVV